MCHAVNIQWIFIEHFSVPFHWSVTKWRAFLLVWIATQIEKDREEEARRQWPCSPITAKIYFTFVCFVDLFQSILMYGGQRLKLKDTSREGAVASSDPVYAYILFILFAALGLLFFVYGSIYFRVSEVILDNFVWWRAVNITIFDWRI